MGREPMAVNLSTIDSQEEDSRFLAKPTYVGTNHTIF